MSSHRNMKKIIILALTVFLLCLAMFGSAAYAWLANSKSASSVTFEILQIDALVNLYKANDTNYNGVYDYLPDGDQGKYYNPEENSYVTYAQAYYKEKYSFDFVAEKWAQSSDTVLNLFDTVNDNGTIDPSITLEEVMPSKIYGYKFEMFNYINLAAKIHFNFEEIENITDARLKQLSTMEVRLGVVSSADGSLTGDEVVTYSDWTPFVTETANADGTKTLSYGGISLNEGVSNMVLPARPANDGTGLTTGRVDIWLQIRQKEDTTETMGAITLPGYRIKLEMTSNDAE